MKSTSQSGRIPASVSYRYVGSQETATSQDSVKLKLSWMA